MKKVFIPKGETVRHNSLYTERLIVNGLLQVSGKLAAKEILGSGAIEAGEIICDDIHADHLTVDYITATRIAVNKLFVRQECRASEAVAVRDYASAGYMNTGKLSITLSDIPACDADQVIILKRKNSLLSLLWASWWRCVYLDLFYGGKTNASEAEEKQVETEEPKQAA